MKKVLSFSVPWIRMFAWSAFLPFVIFAGELVPFGISSYSTDWADLIVMAAVLAWNPLIFLGYYCPVFRD